MAGIMIALLGACIGSFMGVVIDRFPQESILFPASHCNHCKRHLKAWDLIPIISQLTTGSKCRYCQAKIPYWYFLIECSASILTLLVAYQIISPLEYCLVLCGLVLSIYDIKHREYPILVWSIFTFISLLFSALNWLFIGFLLLGWLAEKYQLSIGSGDLLYMASLSLLFGWTDMLWIIQFSSILGLLACSTFKKKPLPFIPFLLLGSLLVFFLF